ncbi:hypothetical protein ACWGQ5_46900 [Streptomyces sp. NPDC055722]
MSRNLAGKLHSSEGLVAQCHHFDVLVRSLIGSRRIKANTLGTAR